MFQVTRSGAWLLDGRLYKSLRIGFVYLRVCSGPQQTRLFVRVNDLAEILTQICTRGLATPSCKHPIRQSREVRFQRGHDGLPRFRYWP